MIVNADSIVQHVKINMFKSCKHVNMFKSKWNDETCQCECRNYRMCE